MNPNHCPKCQGMIFGDFCEFCPPQPDSGPSLDLLATRLHALETAKEHLELALEALQVVRRGHHDDERANILCSEGRIFAGKIDVYEQQLLNKARKQ